MGQRERRGDAGAIAWLQGPRLWALAAGGGLVAAMALLPSPLPAPGLTPLLWLALALLWSLLESAAPRRAAACWAGVAVAVSHRWLLALHPLDWIGVPLPLSLPLCWLLLLFCGALAAALLACWAQLALWLRPRRLSSGVILACIWGLAEVALARGPLFWIGLGEAALPGDPPLAALARLGGAALVAAVQVWLGWALWRLLLAGGLQARRLRRGWGLLLLALLGLHAAGSVQLALLAAPAAAVSQEQVLLLQPAIPTRETLQPQARRRLERLLLAGLEQASALDADLLLLPEGALGLEPRLPLPAPVEVLSGGFRWADTGGARLEQRSALLRFPAGGQRAKDALDKHRLVPLGEWVPLASLLSWSGLSAVGGLQPGAPSRLLARPPAPVAAAICYEIADGASLAQAVAAGGGWLLASANLDPYPLLLQQQFTALARMRAMETGRWLVSVANTGPSQLISPAGVVQLQLPVAKAATGLVTVPVLDGVTPYARWRETGVLLILLLAILAWLRDRRRSPERSPGNGPKVNS